jgi:CxxC motif-containing protein (DUF1111 family)
MKEPVMESEKSLASGRYGLVALVVLLVSAALLFSGSSQLQPVHAQTTLGSPLPGLTSSQLTHFTTGMTQFDFPWDPVHGLGPVYTNTNCNNCHAVPVFGGYNTKNRVTFFGALNSDGSFNPLTNEGGIQLQPLTVAKFIPGCTVVGEFIPPDATIIGQRLPPPLFGDGLIDNIDDSAIMANAVNKGMGIQGSVNMVTDWNGNMRVGRFGQKAQSASLLQMVGLAFGHDVGITNPVVTTEDCPQGNCSIPGNCVRRSELNDMMGVETVQMYDFLVYLAPNTPGAGNSNGQALFTSIGCALCHNPSYTTDPNVAIPVDFLGHVNGPPILALSNQKVNLYSDLLIHDMGPGLADNIPMGQATGSQWRTTPLWGLSFRTVYLHDGRTSNLTKAITMHGGEATQVINGFKALSPSDQADLLTFIQSL